MVETNCANQVGYSINVPSLITLLIHAERIGLWMDTRIDVCVEGKFDRKIENRLIVDMNVQARGITEISRIHGLKDEICS